MIVKFSSSAFSFTSFVELGLLDATFGSLFSYLHIFAFGPAGFPRRFGLGLFCMYAWERSFVGNGVSILGVIPAMHSCTLTNFTDFLAPMDGVNRGP